MALSSVALTVLLIASASAGHLAPSADPDVSACKQYLQKLVGASQDQLAQECKAQHFLESKCQAALLLIGGEPLTQAQVEPACTILFQQESQADLSVGAALRKRGSFLAVTADSSRTVEGTMTKKKGDPNFFVQSDEPSVHFTADRPGPVNAMPPISTDNTLMQPPDADGNPYSQPVWVANSAPPSESSSSLLSIAVDAVKTVEGKRSVWKGDPDYFVQSEEPDVHFAADRPGPVNAMPPISTDNTLMQPPDADGNPYSQPVWVANSAPPTEESSSLLAISADAAKTVEGTRTEWKGDPDYFVKSDEPDVHFAAERPGPVDAMPPISTDNTLMQPPDADGNPYSQPVWVANSPAPTES